MAASVHIVREHGNLVLRQVVGRGVHEEQVTVLRDGGGHHQVQLGQCQGGLAQQVRDRGGQRALPVAGGVVHIPGHVCGHIVDGAGQLPLPVKLRFSGAPGGVVGHLVVGDDIAEGDRRAPVRVIAGYHDGVGVSAVGCESRGVQHRVDPLHADVAGKSAVPVYKVADALVRAAFVSQHRKSHIPVQTVQQLPARVRDLVDVVGADVDLPDLAGKLPHNEVDEHHNGDNEGSQSHAVAALL